MSCGTPQVPARVAQVVEERRRVDKRAEELEQELARVIGSNLLTAMQEDGLQKGDEMPFVKHYHRTDDPARALGFLQSIVSFGILAPLSSADKIRPYTFVLTSTPVEKRSTNITTVLVLGSDDTRAKAAGEALKSKLGVKGGGKGPRWSGKFVGVWRDDKEGSAVKEALESL